MVGRRKRIAVAEADERSVLRALDQPQFGFEHDHAGALCPDQRLRHVKSVFRQQLIEVVAGDAPGNFRILRADQAGVLVADVPQLGIDRAAPPSLRNDGIEFGLAGNRAHRHLRAVVEQNAQLDDVVDRFSGQQGMRAAGIISDHSAERAAAVRGWIGAERQLMLLRAVAQRIQNDAGLDARESSCRVDLQNLVHVLREIQNHGDVAGLPGEARAGAARQDRRAEFPARGHRRDHIVVIARNHEADRNLPVIRAVRGIQRAAAAVEAHFALHHAFQFVLEFAGLRERIHGLRMRTERQRR